MLFQQATKQLLVVAAKKVLELMHVREGLVGVRKTDIQGERGRIDALRRLKNKSLGRHKRVPRYI